MNIKKIYGITTLGLKKQDCSKRLDSISEVCYSDKSIKSILTVLEDEYQDHLSRELESLWRDPISDVPAYQRKCIYKITDKNQGKIYEIKAFNPQDALERLSMQITGISACSLYFYPCIANLLLNKKLLINNLKR